MGLMNLGSPSIIAEKRELLITHVTAMYDHLQTSRPEKITASPILGSRTGPTEMTDTCLSRVFPVGV